MDEELADEVLSLKHILTLHATGQIDAMLEADYVQHRGRLLADPELAPQLPALVHRCETLHQATIWVDQEVGSHPPARVRHLRHLFKPLLDNIAAERKRQYRARRAVR